MRYTGILAKKIPNLGRLSAPGTTLLAESEADRAFDAEIDKRLTALFAHYRLEPQLVCPKGAEAEAVWDLMIELARAHVPGFTRERERGTAKRPRGRPLGRIAKQSLNERAIFRAVERLRKANPKLSVRAACDELIRADRKTYGLETADALRRYKAYASLIGLTRKDIEPETKHALRDRFAR